MSRFTFENNFFVYFAFALFGGVFGLVSMTDPFWGWHVASFACFGVSLVVFWSRLSVLEQDLETKVMSMGLAILVLGMFALGSNASMFW